MHRRHRDGSRVLHVVPGPGGRPSALVLGVGAPERVLVCLDFFPQLLNAFTQIWRVNRRPVADPQLQPVGTNLLPLGWLNEVDRAR